MSAMRSVIGMVNKRVLKARDIEKLENTGPVIVGLVIYLDGGGPGCPCVSSCIAASCIESCSPRTAAYE